MSAHPLTLPETPDARLELPIECQPDISHIITEDDTPVDNLPSEKNQRLLVEPLYSSWKETNPERKFLAAANVGLFYMTKRPPVVPDVMLSLEVEIDPDWWEKEHQSYFIWEFGKPPEVVIEIVSNTVGNEGGDKLVKYAWMKVDYYAIFDPKQQISDEVLRVYELQGGRYIQRQDWKLAGVQLGLTLWDGEFEGRQDTWLRWTDAEGNLIPTGKERADAEKLRAEKLAAKLKELGIDPDLL